MGDMRIRLLGGFCVTVGGRDVPAAQWRLRKAAALVKLLALAPGHRLHREQIVDALWPELSARAGANQLRKALHEARRVLDPDPGATSTYIEGGDELRLPTGHGTRVDTEEFQSAVFAARRSGDPEAYRDALALYGGDLLPEDRYEEWAVPVHDALRDEYLCVLLEQARLLESRAKLDGAAAALRQVLAADPAHEDAATALMRVDGLAGRHHEALAVYERLCTALARQDAGPPGVVTQRLFEQIKTGRSGRAPWAAGLWEQIGDLRLLSGDGAGAAAALRAALDAEPAPDAASTPRLHRKIAQALLTRQLTDEAEPHLRIAERAAAVQGADEAERGRVNAARATWLYETGHFDQAQEQAEAALKTAERAGTPDDVAAAGETLAIVCHIRGAWREGLHLVIERYGAAADEDRGLARIFDIHCCIGEYHLYGDGLSETVEDYARCTLDLALARRARRAQAFAWCLLGEALLLQGRWDEAPGCLERSAELHAELDGRSGVLPWQRLAELAACRGDSERAAACLNRGLAIAAAGTLSRHAWGRLYATAAFDALERHAPDEAVRAVRAAGAAMTRDGGCPSCSALLNPMAAQAFVALGDVTAARAAASAAGQVAELFQSAAWSAMAADAQGSLALAGGDPAGARSRFLAAAGLYESARQPFWAARSRLQAAQAGAGPADADRDLLAQARSAFDRLGAVRAMKAAGRASP
ncbi:BTAD domain-containing putative transcriptional regulator [Streptomyces wedmorensis]|uniref:BTAD domain-containing putative transcriptional regulator n=1 Tax=Streptomyces wedmorensis TaxID=43759 RepID=A0ABW6J649_STRWE